MKKSFLFLLAVLSVGQVQGAVFAGTNDNFPIRLGIDSPFARPFVSGTANFRTEIVAGQHLSSDFSLRVTDIPGPFTTSESFTDPNTFVTETFTTEVTISEFTLAASLGSGALQTDGADLTSSPTLLGGSATVTGTYRITGPDFIVSQPFTRSSPIESAFSNPIVNLSNIDFPNSLDYQVGGLFYVLPRNPLPIFSEVIEGRQFGSAINNLAVLPNFGDATTLNAIPEPNSTLLAAMGALVLLRTRRRKF